MSDILEQPPKPLALCAALLYNHSCPNARVAELVDALVSGTSEVTLVEVQVLSRAPDQQSQDL